MTPTEELAVRAAVRAVTAHEAAPTGGCSVGPSAVDVLEAHAGPLSWSLDGDVFRLLREVAARTNGSG